jgi:hypothetical protein
MPKHNLDETVALLARTPASLDAFLRGLPQVWTHRNEGHNTWSVFEVIGHLIFGERTDWMPRVRIILRAGDKETFEPFDRNGHAREIEGKTLAKLLDEFARLRAENLVALEALKLSPSDLERRGRHPSQGIVTLSELLAAWAVHDLTHLHQISRIMASQYREAVGEWSPFLGVLQCNGHSASD